MLIRVLSRDSAERYVEDEKHVLISITDPLSPAAELPNNEKRLDLLRLEFWDLVFVPASWGPESFKGGKDALFTNDLAKLVLNFWDQWKDRIATAVVHCEAGISRSAGVAAALSKIENNMDLFYFKNYVPNRRVYSMILTEYFGRMGAKVVT